jgi:hypothetical protein
MRKQTPVQQRHAYRIVPRGNQFAVYDKHSKFRVICDTAAEAQQYVTEHSQRLQRRSLSSEVFIYA